jgi:hypothetical protein
VGGAGLPDRRRPCSASTIGDIRQPAAETLVAGVDRSLAASLGILDDEEADVGQAELAGIEHLDGDDLAPPTQPGKRRSPGLGGGDEVRDHDGEPTPAQDVAETVDGLTEIDLPADR